MVRNSIREIEDSELLVPPGYVEYFTKRTGNIYYEDLNTGQKWFTALDGGSRLYFYTEREEGSGEFRSEWSLPPLSSPLACEVSSVLATSEHHMSLGAIKFI